MQKKKNNKKAIIRKYTRRFANVDFHWEFPGYFHSPKSFRLRISTSIYVRCYNVQHGFINDINTTKA